MAQVSIVVKSFLLAFVLAIFSVAATVSAQDSMAPAPSPDAGAGFSLPVSGAVVGVSLLASVVGLLRH
ncbi:hypothetical protein LguiA_014448 [Lonicera macranthoides]